MVRSKQEELRWYVMMNETMNWMVNVKNIFKRELTLN